MAKEDISNLGGKKIKHAISVAVYHNKPLHIKWGY